VTHVEVLLEVVAQREVDERPPIRRQLHGRREAPLHDRQIAGRQMAKELVDVRPDLETWRCRAGERLRIDAWSGDDDHAQRG